MPNNLERPNLLFVFSDQHRWCDLNCYGNTQVISPHLDAFSKKSVQLENCIANSPLCVPSRGSMLSGLHPLKHGAAGNDLPLSDDVETVGHVLADSGYHTGYIGKWHLAGVPRDQSIPSGKRRFGFKEWKVANCTHDYLHSYYDDEENVRHPIEGYEPIEQTNLALDFIQRNSGQPWGLVLSWGPPHDPYALVPQEYVDLYKDIDIQLRDNVGERALSLKKEGANREDIIRDIKGYYAHITALDKQFGRIIKQLEQTGQLENTIIVYTSDHGDMLGSQGQYNKQLPYEESIKVPLLVFWQGRTITLKRNELIGLVDLPVSVLGLMGLHFTNNVDGEDLHNLFTNQEAQGKESCYIHDLTACHISVVRGTPQWRGIRTERYTYAKTVHNEDWMLYDNIEDPYQMKNLVSHPEIQNSKEELNRKLDEYITKHDGLVPWDDLAEQTGLKDKWDESQAHFLNIWPGLVKAPNAAEQG
ncbi:sulfatase [Paenibacillus periandrae]|uniref:sulfatase family protein n=1 Tax=Paenibacillus periandrae TaxID=1761741 RepID=UPI001F08A0CD|nr:sulfatase [Paenibacillus periandrae]